MAKIEKVVLEWDAVSNEFLLLKDFLCPENMLCSPKDAKTEVMWPLVSYPCVQLSKTPARFPLLCFSLIYIYEQGISGSKGEWSPSFAHPVPSCSLFFPSLDLGTAARPSTSPIWPSAVPKPTSRAFGYVFLPGLMTLLSTAWTQVPIEWGGSPHLLKVGGSVWFFLFSFCFWNISTFPGLSGQKMTVQAFWPPCPSWEAPCVAHFPITQMAPCVFIF